jgi:hypothetical protein
MNCEDMLWLYTKTMDEVNKGKHVTIVVKKGDEHVYKLFEGEPNVHFLP